MPEYTIVIVRQEERVLLGMKKRGWCQGFWNGFGGKVKEGETPQDAAVRELAEECGITATAIVGRGIVTFTFRDHPKIVRTHIFEVTSFTGEPVESEEMRPQWFDLRDIPYDQMLAADKHFLPKCLAGETLDERFLYDDPESFTLLEYNGHGVAPPKSS